MVADLGDSSGYTWIGTSYLLARLIPSMIELIAVLYPCPCMGRHQIYGGGNQFYSLLLDSLN